MKGGGVATRLVFLAAELKRCAITSEPSLNLQTQEKSFKSNAKPLSFEELKSRHSQRTRTNNKYLANESMFEALLGLE